MLTADQFSESILDAKLFNKDPQEFNRRIKEMLCVLFRSNYHEPGVNDVQETFHVLSKNAVHAISAVQTIKNANSTLALEASPKHMIGILESAVYGLLSALSTLSQLQTDPINN